jgi:hypothetical protein
MTIRGVLIGALLGLWEGLDSGFDAGMVLVCVVANAIFCGLIGLRLDLAKKAKDCPASDGRPAHL